MDEQTNPWLIEWTRTATKQLAKIQRKNPGVAKDISDTLDAIAQTGKPRAKGKGLTGPRSGEWRYRIGDYRAIVELQDNNLVVLALSVGHRSTVYK